MSAARRRFPHRRLVLAAAGLLAIVVVLWLARGFHEAPAAPAPPTAAVEVAPIVVRVRETGTVIPRLAVEVKSKVGGEVVKMAATEGQVVEAGTVLAQIDQTDFVSRVRQAEADLASARARLSALVEGSRPQEIAQAEAEVARARIALADAEKTEKRLRALLEEGFVSRSEVDAAITQREIAEQALVRAREALSLAREGTRQQEIVQARAAVLRAEDVLRNAREQLRDTVIRAPISGTVIRRKVNEGEIVTAGNVSTSVGTLLLVVADLSELLVRSKVNEVDVPRIAIGQPAEVRLDALLGTVYRGEVVRIAPAGDRDASKNVVTYEVDVRLADPDERIRPEMTASVDIIVGRKARALVVPAEAVEREAPRADGTVREVVYVRRGEGTAATFEPVPVTTGLRNETHVEILSGVEAGDVVRLGSGDGDGPAGAPRRGRAARVR
ncbi:MAG TPA: efflux RND transporter periplasmic adaptor subunit [Thermodesulfobacteriota bacterium]